MARLPNCPNGHSQQYLKTRHQDPDTNTDETISLKDQVTLEAGEYSIILGDLKYCDEEGTIFGDIIDMKKTEDTSENKQMIKNE